MHERNLSLSSVSSENRRIVSFGLLFLLVLLSVFPLFTRLDRLPIRLFDESRLAVSSYEMARSGNYLVPTYEGQPDMWNTKPPLMIWCQALLVKCIGDGELAVRLPSAFAGLLTILLVYYILAFRFHAPLWGFMAGVILVSSHGYVNLHSTRTGDYDALLTLFTTAYLFSWYRYIRSDLTKRKYFVFTCAFIILAVLTKGVAGLLFVPVLLLYAWNRGHVPRLIRMKSTYAGILLVMLFSVGYYLVRESVNPGYMKVVFQNEWSGRYFEVNEGHDEPWYFYIRNFRDFQFSSFYPLIFVSFVFSFFTYDRRASSFIRYSLFAAAWFILVISVSQTKLEWYDVPVYPLFAVICAGPFYLLSDRISGYFPRHPYPVTIAVASLFAVYSFVPYQRNFSKNFYPKEYEWTWSTYQMSHLFRDALRGKENILGYGYSYDGYHAHLLYYRNLLRDKGIRVPERDYRALVPGDKIIVSSPEAEKFIEANYRYSKTRLYNHIVAFYSIE